MRAPNHSRAEAAARSTAICEASASSSTPNDASSPGAGPSSATTSAGPTAYQPSLTTITSRSAWALPVTSSGSSPNSEPAATRTGTQGAGVRNSIGTNTSWVGRCSPVPSWKRTRRISA